MEKKLTKKEYEERLREQDLYLNEGDEYLEDPDSDGYYEDGGYYEETGYLAVLGDEGIVPTPRPTGAVSDDEKDKIVNCVDINGNPVEMTKSSITFLPLNAFLTELKFTDEQGTELPIYPEFTMDNFDYSIVGDSFSSVNMECTAVEGYAANVKYSNAAVFPTIPSISNTLLMNEGVNTLAVDVTTIDGITRTYTLHLLNGQDSEGFRKTTLSQFPESYGDGLWLLHCLHPAYRFEAYQTGLDFEEVLSNEDKGSRSLISSTYNPNWVKPGSPVYDGSSWRAAKRDVIRYFLDPRNFLTPTGVFQFEKLSFDESVHTIDGISAMTKNSFLCRDPSEGGKECRRISVLFDVAHHPGDGTKRRIETRARNASGIRGLL